MWIRNWRWDATWILSGPLLGALATALAFWPFVPVLQPIARTIGTHLADATIIAATAILLQFAHALSPVMLAWSHRDYRAIVRARAAWYIWLPVGLMGATGVVGYLAPADIVQSAGGVTVTGNFFVIGEYVHPFMLMVWAYLAWNAYHFGSQNFGVLSIYRVKFGGYMARQRGIDRGFALGSMTLSMAVIIGYQIQQTELNPYASYYLFYALKWTTAGFLGLGVALIARELRRHSWPRALFMINIAIAPFLIMWWEPVLLRWANVMLWETHEANPALARIIGNYRFPIVNLWSFALLALNHWLVAIGLAAEVYTRKTRRPFAVPVLASIAAGITAFVVLFVHFPDLVIATTPTAAGIRFGVGMVHFTYDGGIWKRGGTISRELFSESSSDDRAFLGTYSDGAVPERFHP